MRRETIAAYKVWPTSTGSLCVFFWPMHKCPASSSFFTHPYLPGTFLLHQAHVCRVPSILLFLHLIAAALTQPKHIPVSPQVCPQIQVSLLPGKAASGLFRGSFLIFSITGGLRGIWAEHSAYELQICADAPGVHTPTHQPIHPWANYLPFHYPSITHPTIGPPPVLMLILGET